MYKETTHLFADFSRLKPGDFRVDLSEATANGITCLKPEYIADYLMQVMQRLTHLVLVLLCFVFCFFCLLKSVSKFPTSK